MRNNLYKLNYLKKNLFRSKIWQNKENEKNHKNVKKNFNADI